MIKFIILLIFYVNGYIKNIQTTIYNINYRALSQVELNKGVLVLVLA